MDKFQIPSHIKDLVADVREILGFGRPGDLYRKRAAFYGGTCVSDRRLGNTPCGIPVYSGIYVESRAAGTYLSAHKPRGP